MDCQCVFITKVVGYEMILKLNYRNCSTSLLYIVMYAQELLFQEHINTCIYIYPELVHTHTRTCTLVLCDTAYWHIDYQCLYYHDTIIITI